MGKFPGEGLRRGSPRGSRRGRRERVAGSRPKRSPNVPAGRGMSQVEDGEDGAATRTSPATTDPPEILIVKLFGPRRLPFPTCLSPSGAEAGRGQRRPHNGDY